jgi:hypothetical protein
MRRPNWHSAMFAAVSGVVGLSILAGCTSRPYGISASDETARYLQGARGRYVIPGPAGDPWGPYIREASNKYDMPESWIRALMRQESGGNLYRNGQLITSGAGAMGLMQVMPGTYRELRARHNLGPDPFDPHDNIMAGVGYMREMYDMYGAPGFLAAYNAGPNRLDDYLSNQRSLPDETRHYVAVIGPSLRYAQPKVHSPAEQFAMNQLPLSIPPGPRFGSGSVGMPTVQVASAGAGYTPAAYTTQTPVPPAYSPAPQPAAVAWAEPPRAVFTSVPAPQPHVLAWADQPRPVQAYAPPPQRTVVARAEEPDDQDFTPTRRRGYGSSHETIHQLGSTRVALMMPRLPPVQRSGGGLHLISSAVAAEVFPVHHGKRTNFVPVSYPKASPQEQTPKGSSWKLHASGPTQAPPACHKDGHHKTVCL